MHDSYACAYFIKIISSSLDRGGARVVRMIVEKISHSLYRRSIYNIINEELFSCQPLNTRRRRIAGGRGRAQGKQLRFFNNFFTDARKKYRHDVPVTAEHLLASCAVGDAMTLWLRINARRVEISSRKHVLSQIFAFNPFRDQRLYRFPPRNMFKNDISVARPFDR